MESHTYQPGVACCVSADLFGYSARGEATDAYQLVPGYGNWFRVSQSYAANGALAGLRGYTVTGAGVNTPFTDWLLFNHDGEGRPFGSWDATNGSLLYWTGTNYNTAAQPTSVGLISGGETFSYDANSGRMTQWSSTAGTSNTQTGNLTWSANGTLKQLAITDAANAANAQTCNYLYDDLARVASANCGSAWSQSFGYDPQGNIWKAGNVNFQQGYNGLSHVLGFSYDNDGNVTNDLTHAYAYDAEGRPTAVDSVLTYYDAFNRAMFQNRSGAYTEILYTPTGQKFALMTGSSASTGTFFVPMVAGVQAVFNVSSPVSTLAYYRHADWQGSSRFGSTTTGTVSYDRAYAPFGEPYAETSTTSRSYTGQTQDTKTDGTVNGTTGLYDFLFRQNSPAQGLWLVPDPAGLAAVDITNPQTWNRYAYVGNNPLNAVDPLGLCNPELQDCHPPPSWAWLAFQGWAGRGDDQSFFCMLMGGCPGGSGSSEGGGGGGQAQPPAQTKTNPQAPNNGRQPNKITCGTVLPNGRTVGSYVNQLSSGINPAAQKQAINLEAVRKHRSSGCA